MSPRQKTTFTHEHVVLGFLKAQPMHAYALHQRLRESPIGQIWHIKQAAFYAVVTRLQGAGFVTPSGTDEDSRGKRLLACTASGAAVFVAWLTTPVAHPRDMRIEFLAKYFFCASESPEDAIQLCTRQLDVCRHWVDTANELVPHPFLAAVQQYRSGQIQATIAWLERAIRHPLSLQIPEEHP